MQQLEQLKAMRDSAKQRLQASVDYKLAVALDALITEIEGLPNGASSPYANGVEASMPARSRKVPNGSDSARESAKPAESAQGGNPEEALKRSMNALDASLSAAQAREHADN